MIVFVKKNFNIGAQSKTKNFFQMAYSIDFAKAK